MEDKSEHISRVRRDAGLVGGKKSWEARKEKGVEMPKHSNEKLSEYGKKGNTKRWGQSENPQCPNCTSKDVIKNGRKDNKQRYLCKTCKTSFTEDNDS